MTVRLILRRIRLIFIVVLLGLSIAALSVKTIHIGSFNRGQADTPLGLKLGLDLSGGTQLVYRADDPNVSKAQIDGVAKVIERRVNAFGVGEPLIQVKGQNEIVIQLPGVSDIEEAKKLIGGTAQLDFRECADANVSFASACASWKKATAAGNNGVEKELTGAFLQPNSTVESDPRSGLPEVRFEFNGEGARMFETITRRLLQKPLGIFLDNSLVSAPTVQGVISQTGVITGVGANEAKLLAIQLNAGALPVAINVVRQEDVSATLGKDSLDRSYFAAGVGLALGMLFMMPYYRLPGVLASMALVLYTLIVLAIFKVFPVTLTLSGIAAFIVSVGMAVDANVLIFERMRDELRTGRTLGAAIETGFERAWPAIRDGHVTILITMLILWWFGDQLGESRVIGFAITLTVSVLMSLFTAIYVTRTFLRAFIGTGFARRIQWFAPVKEREARAGKPVLGL